MRAARQATLLLATLAALAWPGLAPATEELRLLHHGTERSALLDRAPASAGPAPLLVVLHGALLNGAAMRGLTDLSEAAQAAGAAVVYPDAYGAIWSDGVLSASLPGFLSAADDIGFLDALVDHLVARRVADPARIHMVGISNGGMMGFAYACRRAERLASLVVFKATMAADAPDACRPSRPVPVLIAAGTGDPIVRWDGRVVLGGIIELSRRLPVPDGFAFWVRANGCAAVSGPVTLPRRGAEDAPWVALSTGIGCREGAEARLYAIIGGGHRMPGGEGSLLYRALGRATPDADATALVLEFTLPRRRG